MTPDFSQMYTELGLQPDCSLEQFQRAYRQRLSERHPDRTPSHAADSGALPLNELIALHASAIAFHREQGRLPGSALPATPPLRVAPIFSAAASDADDSRTSSARWLLAGLLLAGALLAGVFLESAPPQPISAEPSPPSSAVADPLPAPEVPSGPLELGMDAQTVRAIQGDPMRINDNIWEYGPSWLRIEHDQLVDWYSSPLYRLKTRTPSPAADTHTRDNDGR